jgi:hypothetical protein
LIDLTPCSGDQLFDFNGRRTCNALSGQKTELILGQTAPGSVRQEAINVAGDVAQMESNGGRTRFSPDLLK